MNKINLLAAIMPFIEPLINEITEKVAEKVAARVIDTTVNKEPKFYNRVETAELLRITLPTLARITKEGLIIAKRIGGRVLYDANAIDDAVRERRCFKYKHAN